MAGDLHTHSTCSDGSVPIHRLPLMAARLGLSALALSDHDTTLSAQYAYDHPVQDGVRLIPAAAHRLRLRAQPPRPSADLLARPRLPCPAPALRHHAPAPQRVRSAELPGDRGTVPPSSAPSRRWNMHRTAASSLRAASCRRCSSWACATASTPGFITSCSAGSRGASASTPPTLPSGAGGAGHGKGRWGRGGVRPPDGVQEYALCCGSWWLKGAIDGIEGASPPQQPRGYGRVR